MKVYKDLSRSDWEHVLARPAMDTSQLDSTVSDILMAVKAEGDSAIRRFTAQFDKIELDHFEVTFQETVEASSQLSLDLKKAIDIAYQNIKTFHAQQQQSPEVVETMPGVSCWRKSVGIEKVGLYIPGGTAPLFSTVLMLGVPAKIAGCREIILCSPPGQNGKLHPAILYTAQLIGINRIFKIGGVQAIGGMAYGTESIPKVYKIFGPGNQYVTSAKQLVNKEGIAIDMPAGPSEVLVCADESANPAFVAADLLSQAEHGADSQVVLVTLKAGLIEAVQEQIQIQLASLPRKEIATKALANSVAILARDKKEAIEIINSYAPEHLILAIESANEVGNQIINAGSIFLGNYTPESVGDYASGTNHTLPTNGYARAYSGVSLDSFVKKITFQRLTMQGLQNIGPAVEQMAEAEELMAHKRAISIRLNA